MALESCIVLGTASLLHCFGKLLNPALFCGGLLNAALLSGALESYIVFLWGESSRILRCFLLGRCS